MVLWLCSNEHTVVSDPALGQPISRRVKKSGTPAGTVLAAPGLGQGTWIVQTGRCGGPRWVEGGGSQRGGFDLEIGSDEFFDCACDLIRLTKRWLSEQGELSLRLPAFNQPVW